jgi:hypothetical protein
MVCDPSGRLYRKTLQGLPEAMTPYWDNGIVQMHHGDARDVLAQLESELAQLGLLRAPVVEGFHLLKHGLASGDLFHPHGATANPNRLPPSRLHVVHGGWPGTFLRFQLPQFNQKVCLSSLDLEVWAQRTDGSISLPVSGRPGMEWLPVPSRGLLDCAAPSEQSVEHVDSNRSYLLDPHALGESGVAGIAPNPLMVGAPLDREESVSIHDAG